MARGNNRDGDSSHVGGPDADLTGNGAPVDVAAVRRDDALIDAIAGGGPIATDSPEQYELAVLLSNWRADIVSTPMPAGPLLDDVIAAMNAPGASAGRLAEARGHLRLLRPIASAAAAVAMIVGGATVFSYNAEPGDPLWSVKEVVFSEQADSTVAKIDTTSQLQEAERLIAAGDVDTAKSVLATAAARADDVREADNRGELEVWWDKLSAEVQKIAPTAPPSTTTAPSVTSTGLPVPPVLGSSALPIPPTGVDELPSLEVPPILPQLPTLPLPTLPPAELPFPPFPSPQLPSPSHDPTIADPTRPDPPSSSSSPVPPATTTVPSAPTTTGHTDSPPSS